MTHFGRIRQIRAKESIASVVTEADLAAERCIFDLIRGRFPEDGLLGEESGFQNGKSGRVWIVDPLDGTSNFVAGLPWFGVMIALLENNRPAQAALYLPVGDTLYHAVVGGGAFRNGEPVRVTTEEKLENLLVAYGFDASAETARTRREAGLLVRVVNHARNVRATNSLVDFCYTIDGRLGGVINQACKIWDIAPTWLILTEAGGRVTDLAGRDLDFAPGPDVCQRTYQVLGAAPTIHQQLLALTTAADGENRL
jgi:myo-inositol-1(or 4)-monophosphatase